MEDTLLNQDWINDLRQVQRMGQEGLLWAYYCGPAALIALAEDPQIDAPIRLHVSRMPAGLQHINSPRNQSCIVCVALI